MNASPDDFVKSSNTRRTLISTRTKTKKSHNVSVQERHDKATKTSEPEPTSSKGKKCPCCEKDIEFDFSVHVNYCLARFSNSKSPPSLESKTKPSGSDRGSGSGYCVNEKKESRRSLGTEQCPFCSKKIINKGARASHVKACEKKSGVKPQEKTTVTTSTANASIPTQRRKKKEEDEDMQLALTLSLSQNGPHVQRSKDKRKRDTILKLRSQEARKALITEKLGMVLMEGRCEEPTQFPKRSSSYCSPHLISMRQEGSLKWKLAGESQGNAAYQAFYVDALGDVVEPQLESCKPRFRSWTQIPGREKTFLSQEIAADFDEDASDLQDLLEDMCDLSGVQSMLQQTMQAAVEGPEGSVLDKENVPPYPLKQIIKDETSFDFKENNLPMESSEVDDDVLSPTQKNENICTPMKDQKQISLPSSDEVSLVSPSQSYARSKGNILELEYSDDEETLCSTQKYDRVNISSNTSCGPGAFVSKTECDGETISQIQNNALVKSEPVIGDYLSDDWEEIIKRLDEKTTWSGDDSDTATLPGSPKMQRAASDSAFHDIRGDKQGSAYEKPVENPLVVKKEVVDTASNPGLEPIRSPEDMFAHDTANLASQKLKIESCDDTVLVSSQKRNMKPSVLFPVQDGDDRNCDENRKSSSDSIFSEDTVVNDKIVDHRTVMDDDVGNESPASLPSAGSFGEREILTNWKSVWKSKRYADVTIKCRDTSLRAHSLVIQVQGGQLWDRCYDPQLQQLILNQWDSTYVNDFLNVLYGGQMETKDYQEVLKIAQQYSVASVISAFKDYGDNKGSSVHVEIQCFPDCADAEVQCDAVLQGNQDPQESTYRKSSGDSVSVADRKGLIESSSTRSRQESFSSSKVSCEKLVDEDGSFSKPYNVVELSPKGNSIISVSSGEYGALDDDVLNDSDEDDSRKNLPVQSTCLDVGDFGKPSDAEMKRFPDKNDVSMGGLVSTSSLNQNQSSIQDEKSWQNLVTGDRGLRDSDDSEDDYAKRYSELDTFLTQRSRLYESDTEQINGISDTEARLHDNPGEDLDHDSSSSTLPDVILPQQTPPKIPLFDSEVEESSVIKTIRNNSKPSIPEQKGSTEDLGINNGSVHSESCDVGISAPTETARNAQSLTDEEKKMIEDLHLEDSALWLSVSEPVQTPQQNRAIQRENFTSAITPKPDYENMSMTDLRKELSRYGLKKLSRRQALRMLDHIYEQLHPLEPVTPKTRSDSPKPGPSGCTQKRSQSNKAKISSSSENSSSDDNDCLEETYREDEEVITQSSTDEQIMTFVRSVPQLHQKILQCEPIWLVQLRQDLKDAGIKCTMAQLMTLFDNQCICYRISQNPRGRRQRKRSRSKSPKKKKRKMTQSNYEIPDN